MTKHQYVYFAAAVDRSLIKIGITAHPEDRLNDIAAGALQNLHVRAVIVGDRQLEKHLHDAWDHCRSHREWFHVTPELDAFVSSVPSIADPFIVYYDHRTKFNLEPLAINAQASGLADDGVKFIVDTITNW